MNFNLDMSNMFGVKKKAEEKAKKKELKEKAKKQKSKKENKDEKRVRSY